jgi:putative nucleotidyltransferase with HDIG domain
LSTDWAALRWTRDHRISLYQAALALTAVGVLWGLVDYRASWGNPWAVLGLAFAAAASERGCVMLGRNTQGSVSLVPTVFAAAVLGPLPAMIVAAGSFVGEFPLFARRARRAELYASGRPYLRWGIYTCVRAIYASAAGLAATTAASLVDPKIARIVVATTVAAAVAEPLDVAFAALTYRLRGGSARESIRDSAPAVLASIPLYAPVVALLGVAYTEFSGLTLAFFFVPALAAQRLYSLYQQQLILAADLSSANAQLERANLSFATALVATLDARDRYTAGHSAAVAIYARDIAVRLGLSEDEQRLAHLCGLVHDIGKIGLPAGLLEKPGALTLEERRLMETHPEIGERILSKVDDYAEIASIVRHHHERIDGQGYPDGLTKEEIPLLSRIIAVADAYNAMTSDRPYRDAMPSRVARVRLAQAVDSQFDTGIVAVFEAILAGASEEYRSGLSPAFRWDRESEMNFTVSEGAAAYSSA